MPRKIWSEADCSTLAHLYPSHPTAHVAAELRRSIASVYAMARKLGLEKSPEFLASPESGRLRKGQTWLAGVPFQFPKGHVPVNKGTRRPGWAPGRMKETQFQKGCRSGIAAKNWVPIGTVRPDPDGYLRIKIREAEHKKEVTGYGNTRVWPLYHRYLWEQAHGPIPTGHLVVFRDGNRGNVTLENLEMISMGENARRNQMWNRLPRELAEVIQLNGALKRKMRKLYGEEQDQ